jgi:hypothetical protein
MSGPRAGDAVNEEIVGAIEKLSHEFWPSAVVLPFKLGPATPAAFAIGNSERGARRPPLFASLP